MAIQQDIEFFSGNNVSLDCAFVDQGSIDEPPFDLSGIQRLEYGLSRKAQGQPIFKKDLNDGVTVLSPVNGLAQIILNAEDSEPLSGIFYHEVRVVDSHGKKLTLMYGSVTIKTNLLRD